MVESIAHDKGLDFAPQGFANRLLNGESYFRKSYRSGEKGGVENFNGVFRRYYLEGSVSMIITKGRLYNVRGELDNLAVDQHHSATARETRAFHPCISALVEGSHFKPQSRIASRTGRSARPLGVSW